jgi:hypothetical protein
MSWFLVINEPVGGLTDQTARVDIGDAGSSQTFTLALAQRGTGTITFIIRAGDSYRPTVGSPIYLYQSNGVSYSAGLALVINGSVNISLSGVGSWTGLIGVDFQVVGDPQIYIFTATSFNIGTLDRPYAGTSAYANYTMSSSGCAFAGTIDSVEVNWLGNAGDCTAIITPVSLEACFDNLLIPPRSYTAQTAGYIVADLLSTVCAGVPVTAGTISAGPTIPGPTIYAFDSVSSAFDTLATLAGFTWYVDPATQTLQFNLPSTTAAPLTITGDNTILESMDWLWSRQNYRNMQVAKLSFAAFPPSTDFFSPGGTSFNLSFPADSITSAYLTDSTRALATCAINTIPANGDTVTVGSAVYTWKTTLDNTQEFEILIGASTAACATNMIAAILADPTQAGTLFSLPTWENGLFNAQSWGASGVAALVKLPGTDGNVYPVSASNPTSITWPSATAESGAGAGTGTTLQVGTAGASTPSDLTYTQGSTAITLAVASTSNLVVVYWRIGGDCIAVRDDALIAARAAIEHGTGKYEMLTDDSSETNCQSGLTFARAALTTYDDLPITFYFYTNSSAGLMPGLWLHLNYVGPANLAAMVNGYWLIQEVDATLIPGSQIWQYQVYVVNATVVNYLNFWLNLSGSGSGGGIVSFSNSVASAVAVPPPPALSTSYAYLQTQPYGNAIEFTFSGTLNFDPSTVSQIASVSVWAMEVSGGTVQIAQILGTPATSQNFLGIFSPSMVLTSSIQGWEINVVTYSADGVKWPTTISFLFTPALGVGSLSGAQTGTWGSGASQAVLQITFSASQTMVVSIWTKCTAGQDIGVTLFHGWFPAASGANTITIGAPGQNTSYISPTAAADTVEFVVVPGAINWTTGGVDPALMTGAITSATFTVAVPGAPTATGATLSLIPTTPTAMVDPTTGWQYWEQSISIGTPGLADLNAAHYQVTVQRVDASGNADPTYNGGNELPWFDFDNDGNTHVQLLQGGYVASGPYTYTRYKVYGYTLAATSQFPVNSWTHGSPYSVLQQWPSSFYGGGTSYSSNFGAMPSGAIPGSRVTGAVATATTATTATSATTATTAGSVPVTGIPYSGFFTSVSGQLAVGGTATMSSATTFRTSGSSPYVTIGSAGVVLGDNLSSPTNTVTVTAGGAVFQNSVTGSIVTVSNLGIVVGAGAYSAITTVSSPVGTSDSTIYVASGTAVVTGGYYLLGSEIIYVGGGGGTTTLSVARNQLGTTAASHSSGTYLYPYNTVVVNGNGVTITGGSLVSPTITGGSISGTSLSIVTASGTVSINTSTSGVYVTTGGSTGSLTAGGVGFTVGTSFSSLSYSGLTFYVSGNLSSIYGASGASYYSLPCSLPFYNFAGSGYFSNISTQTMAPPTLYGTYMPAGLYEIAGYLAGTQTSPPVWLYITWYDGTQTLTGVGMATTNSQGQKLIIRLSGSTNPSWSTNGYTSGSYGVSVQLTKIG